MISKAINKELQEKYGLSEEMVDDSVSLAITRALTSTMRTTVFVNPGDNGLEIFAFRKNGDRELFKVKPETIKPKILRSIQYEIEKSLHAKKTAMEFERYSSLQSQVVRGLVTKIHSNGTLDVEIEREHHFRFETLSGQCTKALQPQHERGKYKVDRFYPFYVHKIRPEDVRGLFRLNITLSRTSPLLTEGLIRKEMESRALGLGSEANRYKCTQRVCGIFSQVVAEKKIDKDIIRTVSRELDENVFVKFGHTFASSLA